MFERKATVGSQVGLHARPASLLAQAVGKVGIPVSISKDGETADDAMDASSILSLMALGAAHGDVIVLRAAGEGALEALQSLAAIVETDHDA